MTQLELPLQYTRYAVVQEDTRDREVLTVGTFDLKHEAIEYCCTLNDEARPPLSYTVIAFGVLM